MVRRPSDPERTSFLVRIDPVCKERLRKWAEATGNSQSAVIEIAIRAGMASQGTNGLPRGWDFDLFADQAAESAPGPRQRRRSAA